MGRFKEFVKDALNALFRPISSEEAEQIAKEECDRLGSPWQEPIGVTRFLGYYSVRTNDGMFGDNVVVEVGLDGKVIRVGR